MTMMSAEKEKEDEEEEEIPPNQEPGTILQEDSNRQGRTVDLRARQVAADLADTHLEVGNPGPQVEQEDLQLEVTLGDLHAEKEAVKDENEEDPALLEPKENHLRGNMSNPYATNG